MLYVLDGYECVALNKEVTLVKKVQVLAIIIYAAPIYHCYILFAVRS